MDVRRVVPAVRQVLRHRHAALEQQRQPHAPVAEIREGNDGVLADPQEVVEYRLRVVGRLQRLRQDHIVEAVVGIEDEVVVGVALDHRQAARHAFVDAALRQLDAASVDLLVGLQQFEQRAVAAADVEHLSAGSIRFGDDLEVDAGRAVHAHADSPRARAAEVRNPRSRRKAPVRRAGRRRGHGRFRSRRRRPTRPPRSAHAPPRGSLRSGTASRW